MRQASPPLPLFLRWDGQRPGIRLSTRCHSLIPAWVFLANVRAILFKLHHSEGGSLADALQSSRPLPGLPGFLGLGESLPHHVYALRDIVGAACRSFRLSSRSAINSSAFSRLTRILLFSIPRPSSARPGAVIFFTPGARRSFEAWIALVTGSECFMVAHASMLHSPQLQRLAIHFG